MLYNNISTRVFSLWKLFIQIFVRIIFHYFIILFNYDLSMPLFFSFLFFSWNVADSGFGNGKGSNSFNLQNRILSSDSALFTTRNNTKVIAQRGGLAVLPCAVKWNPTATVSIKNEYVSLFKTWCMRILLLHIQC